MDDAELVGGVLVDSPDPSRAAGELAALLADHLAPSSAKFDPDLVGVLRARFGSDLSRIEKACELGSAWVMGRRSITEVEFWELVASLPATTALPAGLRRTTGETLMQLVVRATKTLLIVVPFIDRPGMSFLADALAAATKRGVKLEILLPTRSTHATGALGDLHDAIRRDGISANLTVASLLDDAPWAHLKVLSSDGVLAYIGSANVTGAGLAGPNLELGILVRGDAVSAVEKIIDIFRDRSHR